MLTIVQFIVFTVTSLTVFIFSIYLNSAYLFDSYRQWFFTNIIDLQLHDFIVVGAGTAGTTLAARLAEYGYKTLLLEAGGTAPPFLDIPLLAPLIQNTPYDWQYITVPQQRACKALNNNQSKWPMGKLIGGTSRLNYMLHVRGHPLDYKDWLPDFHENNGSVPISDLKWNSGLANIILEGLRELKQDIGNINADLRNGFMKPQLSLENGQRWSPDKLLHEYLTDKLTIITHAHVEKVLMESKRATGVQFVALNKTFKALAKEGVILSAGAIGSPKILMLSGIGPKRHLQALKINVINDLPVGQHLVDHALTGIDLITLNTSIGLSMADTLNPVSALNYFLFGEGPWTFTGVEALGTFHSSFQKNKSSVPDLQLMVMPLGLARDNGVVLKRAMGISEKVYSEYFAPNSYKNTITIAPVLLHPRSEGEVKLSSANSFDPPLIDPKYLSNQDDIAVLTDGIVCSIKLLYNSSSQPLLVYRIFFGGIEFTKKLVETNAMRRIGASIYLKHFPGCEDEKFDSAEYWECYIRHLTLTSYHPAGTCRKGDVVDETFKVYGTENLYVIDASVLPFLPSGNINAAVTMIAEKAARVIKRNIKLQNASCDKPCNYYYASDDRCDAREKNS